MRMRTEVAVVLMEAKYLHGKTGVFSNVVVNNVVLNETRYTLWIIII